MYPSSAPYLSISPVTMYCFVGTEFRYAQDHKQGKEDRVNAPPFCT